MGNTIVYDTQDVGGGCHSKIRNCHRDINLKRLQRKSSSFLVEPVTNKLTDRGEVDVSVGVSDNTTPPVDASDVNKLRYAVSEMQGWRSHMEDKHLLNPKLHSNQWQEQLMKDHHLFAVFDGHGGDFASHFCGEHFVSTLITQKDWKTYLKLSKSGRPSHESVIGLQLLKSALTATFLELDTKLMEAQCQRRSSQLSQHESLVYSLDCGASDDVFYEGTNDHKSVTNFFQELPDSMPARVRLEQSGSTGVVVLVTPSHILCANAGDSRAFLSKKSEESSMNDVLPLSFDHKPSNDSELCRVERDGGFVRSGRVDGTLAVSRAFGDFKYKVCAMDDDDDSRGGPGHTRSNSLPKDHRVTVHPDITVHNRETDKDEFVVLACDGIWDRLTNRECSDLICDLVYDEGEADVGLICEEVIDTALELDSRDNMTVCAVFFPALKNGVPNIDSGVLRRRTDRGKSWGSDSTPAKRAQLRQDKRQKTTRRRAKVPKSQACWQEEKQYQGLLSSKSQENSGSRSQVDSSPSKKQRRRKSAQFSAKANEIQDSPFIDCFAG